MAKEMMMKGGMCPCPHHKVFALIVLLAGVGFLMQDLAIWNFWNLKWWTVAFVFLGLAKLGRCRCCNNHMCGC